VQEGEQIDQHFSFNQTDLERTQAYTLVTHRPSRIQLTVGSATQKGAVNHVTADALRAVESPMRRHRRTGSGGTGTGTGIGAGTGTGIGVGTGIGAGTGTGTGKGQGAEGGGQEVQGLTMGRNAALALLSKGETFLKYPFGGGKPQRRVVHYRNGTC
jgi:hypothetical protein